MAYEVTEEGPVGLPVMEERVVHTMSNGDQIKDFVATGDIVRKEPGETITEAEFKKANQSPEQIKTLIDSGAIREKS